MFETLDKMMLAGLGALSMTRERAEKLFDEYVKKGEVGLNPQVVETFERCKDNDSCCP